MKNHADPSNLLFWTIDEIDPKWAFDEATKMLNFHPCSEKANASGKFFQNYQCWHFHKSSCWPLIKSINKKLHGKKNQFKKLFNKDFNYDFVVLSYVEELNIPVCNFHKDGHFFDGQLHLTIQGNAQIEVKIDKDITSILNFPNGQLWYLNGSHYIHRILPVKIPRIEICLPINQLDEDIKVKLNAISDDQYSWVDGNNREWIELRKKQSQYVLDAIERKTASHPDIASFSV